MSSPATHPVNSPHSLLEQALALCRIGRFAEAETMFRRLVAIQPRQVEALHFLGVVCSQLGNQHEALRHIEAALRIDARSADVHNSRGNVLAALRRFEEAIASFD